jgi:kinetochore protein Nuf2
MARTTAIYSVSQQENQMKTNYKFPVLESRELMTLYNTMGFEIINESTLSKPTTMFMKILIEQIMDKFLCISPYSLTERLTMMKNQENNNENDETNNENESGSYNSIKYDYHPQMNIFASQRVMFNFLRDCGIDDFSIRDISKPDSPRLKIILSALINYARFREERMGDLDELMDKNDETLKGYKELIENNHILENQINEIDINLKNQPHTLEELYNKNEELENQLRSLKMMQKQLNEDHEKYRSEKTGLINELENQSALYIETEKDLEEIRPYIKESPESVKDLIQKMKDSEKKEMKALETVEQKLRLINTSFNSFQFLVQELGNLIKILDEMKVEANRNKNYDQKLKSLKNQLIETKEKSNEYSRKIVQIERQLKHNEERITKLRSFYTEKMHSLEEKLTSQISEFSGLKTQKNLDDVELSEKEAQINNWNNKIFAFQKQFDSECKEANLEFDKLNAKVLLYISEIRNKINDSKDMLSM